MATDRSTEAADRLAASIEQNIPNPTNEALWAAPGTMLGALHMLEWTRERRWHDLFLENVEQVWRTWLPSDDAPCHLWTQDLHGDVIQYLGAGHGFAGNAYPLLRGASLLAAERRESLYDRCVETLRVTAVQDDAGANWPESPRPGRRKILVQWCHGAPGIVTGLADFPPQRSSDMDTMLVKAGATVWKAGPLAKGHGLCHGTAGNGYALLKLYRRTGDPVWLNRARSFAMHAIASASECGSGMGAGATRSGRAIRVLRCTSGIASRVQAGCRGSIPSTEPRPNKASRFAIYRAC